MNASSFQRVVVPLELQPAAPHDPDAIETGQGFVALSQAARESIKTSISLAKHGKICFLHATPVAVETTFYGVPEGGGPVPHPALSDIDDVALTMAQDTLRDLAETLVAEKADYEIRVASGRAIDVILAQSEAFHADLIILPASGRSRMQRLFRGSTTDKIIRDASCPVLVMPAHSNYDTGRRAAVARA